MNEQPTLQDLIRRRQASNFIGRQDELAKFQENLRLAVDDPRRRFLFSIHGDAGVGKTWLVHQFGRIAREQGYVTAFIDEKTAYDVPSALETLAAGFEGQGKSCKDFNDRYKAWRRHQHEVDSDPEAPEGLSSLLTRSAARAGVRAVESTPLVGPFAKEIPTDAFAANIDRVRMFLNRKFRNYDDVQLMLSPISELTNALTRDIRSIATRSPVALFFDTYERFSNILDQWLVDVLAGQYGGLPQDLIITISGQHPLDINIWDDYLSIRSDITLHPFNESEARELLAKQHILNEEVINVILGLTNRLPLLIALLAEKAPSTVDEVVDPSDNAVERFLEWESDDLRRRAALHAALPRTLNKETFTAANSEQVSDEQFEWLRKLPFISEHGGSYYCHRLVRDAMLRAQRRRSPLDWKRRHLKLAEHYQEIRDTHEFDGVNHPSDGRWHNWTIEQYYHLLCAQQSNAGTRALTFMVDAVIFERSCTPLWAQMIRQAGYDADIPELTEQGKRLEEWTNGGIEDEVELLTYLIAAAAIDEQRLSALYSERGFCYRLVKKWDAAISDYNRAVALDQSNSLKFIQRAVTYRAMERFDEALADCDRAVDLDPNDDRNHFQKAMTYRERGELDQALVDFGRAIELDPSDDWNLIQRAVTYRAMERFDEALADCDRAVDLDPNDDRNHFQRALVNNAMRRFDEAIADCNQAIELDPNHGLNFLLRAATFRSVRRFDEALADYDRAIALEDNLDVYVERSATYRSMRRFDEALADSNRAIDFDPSDDRNYRQRATVFRAMERFSEALADCDQAIYLDPNGDQGYCEKAMVLCAMKRFDEALADCNRAIDIDPEESLYALVKGNILRNMNLFDEALAALPMSIDVDDQLVGWGYYETGLVLTMQGDPKRAYDYFLKAHNSAAAVEQNDPYFAQVAFNDIIYLVALGDTDQASNKAEFVLFKYSHDVELVRACIDDLGELVEYSEESVSSVVQLLERGLPAR